jgi:hypothetical protein
MSGFDEDDDDDVDFIDKFNGASSEEFSGRLSFIPYLSAS